MAGSLCGVWVDEAGRGHITVETEGGGREDRTAELRPFAWLGTGSSDVILPPGIEVEALRGEGPFNRLAHAASTPAFNSFMRTARDGANVDFIRPFESQFLLQHRERLYRDMNF